MKHIFLQILCFSKLKLFLSKTGFCMAGCVKFCGGIFVQVGNGAAVLGFVGSPWTLATYIVEGKTTRTYTKIKTMTHQAPDLLHSILSHLAQEIAEYVIFQVKAGAQCIQIFDSWGGQLPPHQWDRWSKPYIQQVCIASGSSCICR
jgi:uroporphyrinogen decarboxylase